MELGRVTTAYVVLAFLGSSVLEEVVLIKVEDRRAYDGREDLSLFSERDCVLVEVVRRKSGMGSTRSATRAASINSTRFLPYELARIIARCK